MSLDPLNAYECNPRNRWLVTVVPKTPADWRAVTAALRQQIPSQCIIMRVDYEGGSAYRLPDSHPCGGTLAKFTACFGTSLAAIADVIEVDCDDPIPANPGQLGSPTVEVPPGTILVTSAIINWTAVSQATTYTVLVTVTAGGATAFTTNVAAPGTTVQATGLTAATGYTVVVTAKRGAGTGQDAGPSTPVTFTTDAAGFAAEAAPQTSDSANGAGGTSAADPAGDASGDVSGPPPPTTKATRSRRG